MAGQVKTTLYLELRNRLRTGLNQAKQEVNSNVNALKAKLREFKSAHVEAFESMKDSIPGLSNALEMLGNPYTLIIAGVIALGGAFIKAVNMNLEWQKSMAKVNVTAQLSKRELSELSDQVLSIATRNTTPLEEVPEAFNKIISAGLDTQTALATLEPTLKAAKAGFTDVETVAGAAVSVMNSSGVSDATRVYDILFATLNKGNAEFADVANYLPKIIPGAKQAGFSLEETAGAFAYLTAQGLKSEAASTGLANAFKSLSNPDIVYGTKTKGGFKALGIEIFDATGKARSLVDISKDLNTSMAGLTDAQRIKKFSELGLDMESAMAFNIMSQNVDKLKDTIDFTTNSQGQLNEAVKAAATPMDSWLVLGNQVKGIFIQIGESGAGWFGSIGQGVLNVIAYFKNLYNESAFLRDIISLIGAYFGLMWDVATFPLKAIWEAIKFIWNILGSVKDAIFGVGDGFENWYLRAKSYIIWVFQYMQDLAKLMLSIATMDFSAAIQHAKDLANEKSLQEVNVQVFKQNQIDEAAFKKGNATIVPSTGIVPSTAKGAPGSPVGGSGNAGKSEKVTGGQQQVRNITFNMDAMIKMGDFVSKNSEMASMNKKELEAWLIEITRRAIANIETSYA
jgi:TP901 family phage tail tape measure protein